jgi:uncharacterized protein (TIGR03067 family)
MARYVVAALAAALLLSAAPAADKDGAKKDQEALQGTWKVVSAERNGRPTDEVKDFRVTFEKDAYTLRAKDSVISKRTFKIDPSKIPKTIDLKVAEGQEKGKEACGIYELTKGGGWRWRSGDTGQEDRPKEFATKEGGGHVPMAMEKEKE